MFEQILILGPVLTILFVSLIVSLLVTLIYKFTTDQKLMASIKKDVDRLRAEIKSAKDPKEMGRINQELMDKSFSQMRASLKPMFITMIPALLVLGWMQANLAYSQIIPGEEFTISAHFESGASGEIELAVPEGLSLLSPAKQKVSSDFVSWKLKGSEGRYDAEIRYGEEVYSTPVLISREWHYADPILEKRSGIFSTTNDKYPIAKDSKLRSVMVNYSPVHPFGEISIFGWQPGWLSSYIVFSLVFSILLRSLLKVH